MPWPTLEQYQSALQHPAHCFADKQLQRGTLQTNAWGIPRLVCGQFAGVCRVECRRDKRAVRIFQREIPERRIRYEAISQHLRSHRDPVFVDFEYHDQGIRVNGIWYPILCMEWVEGEPLHVYVENCMQAGDTTAIRTLADQWIEMLETLERLEVAHGDLQHGNVLIAKGKPRLVDYDGMYVPALAGRASLELGLSDYQHPKRGGSDFGIGLDRFAGLVILIALRALAAQPKLWAHYNGENLLFTASDFSVPRCSKLFKGLQQLGDPEVREWVRTLLEWCSKPHFPVPPPPSPPDPLAAILASFIQYVSQNEDAEAVAHWEHCHLDNYPPAQKYVPMYQAAKKRITPLPPEPPPDPREVALGRFLRAISQNQDAEAVASWEGAHLDTYPPAQQHRSL
jgi:hypothetical protein